MNATERTVTGLCFECNGPMFSDDAAETYCEDGD